MSDPPTPEDERVKAQEAKAIMEARWREPGVADYKRPCQWFSKRHGNPRCGYSLEHKK